jgi:hypothetical protein
MVASSPAIIGPDMARKRRKFKGDRRIVPSSGADRRTGRLALRAWLGQVEGGVARDGRSSQSEARTDL